MEIKSSNRTIKIINSSWDDYEYCYNLTKKNMRLFYKKHKLEWKPKSYRSNFDPKVIKILKYNNRRIGFYKLIFKERGWYLADLQISKLFRGKGIGTEIMILLEKIIKKKSCNTIKLRVFFDNPAVNLYKKIGYKIVKKQGGSYLMKKVI